MISAQNDNGTTYTRIESFFKLFRAQKEPPRCHHQKPTAEVHTLKSTD